jgi:hypothetical protein
MAHGDLIACAAIDEVEQGMREATSGEIAQGRN